jgi:deoxyribose-phosphate aldolase
VLFRSGMIDHSILAPTAIALELEAGCREAIEYGVASVCILPYYLKRCAEILAGTKVLPSTTIGFPHGAHATSAKLGEARQALADGGRELDMVVNVSRVLSLDWAAVRDEVKAMVELSHGQGAALKLIFENCYLQDEHKLALCDLAGELGVDFVKTSTGFGPSGATEGDVRLMRARCRPGVQVKAAGGLKTLDQILAMRAAGATRCGCSRTREVAAELLRRSA